MKSIRRHTILIIILAAASAGTFVFPKDGSIFPHKVHIDNGIECASCHKAINASTTTTSGPDLPGRTICAECHDEAYSKQVKLRYDQCYRMNHKFHITSQGQACRNCHEGLYEKDAPAQEESIVKMEYCFQCHDNTTATRYCMLCHVNPIRPDDHARGWEKLHGRKASSGQKECQKCHASKDSCLRCHRGSKGITRYHNPNYETTHRYESRMTLKNCRACHSDRQCRDCHKSSGVSYKSPLLQQRHPFGWTNRFSPRFHGKKAKLNLASCTTCHTQNECRYCHFYLKKGFPRF